MITKLDFLYQEFGLHLLDTVRGMIRAGATPEDVIVILAQVSTQAERHMAEVGITNIDTKGGNK